MKKLLCIISSMDVGGAETFLMKVFRAMDRTTYSIDFCVSTEKQSYYENEILSMSGRVFRVPPRSCAPFKRFSMIKKLAREYRYDCVLVCNQYELSVLDLIAAKKGGVKRLAYRANSTAIASGGFAKNVLHAILRVPAMCIPTIYIAPSELAAVFVFGKRIVKKGKVNIIHNGIAPDVFRFDADKRLKYRKELGLDDRTVLIHVGRFSPEKNHAFLLRAFSEAVKQNPGLHLLLVGDGPDVDSIRMIAEELQICDKVSFLGTRSDVPNLLMASDLLLLPSLYEGMPNVVIEAQGTGLKCVVSDTVTREADISGTVKYIPLKIDAWAEEMCASGKSGRRSALNDILVAAGYDIDSVVNRFIETVF